MKKFESKHTGDRLFIIGNGPSLNKTPLDSLNNEYTMAMNQINLIYNDVSWRPDYFVYANKNNGNRILNNAKQTVNLDITSFLGPHIKNEFGTKSNINYLGDIINVSDKRKKVLKDGQISEIWSNEVFDHVFTIGSTIYVATQIAAYMGFEEIYLVGCDLWKDDNIVLFDKGNDPANFSFESESSIENLFNFVTEGRHPILSFLNALYYKLYGISPDNLKDDKNHFSGDYLPNHPYTSNKNKKYNEIHGCMKLASSNYGFQIYNATVGGYLEVYERVNISELV